MQSTEHAINSAKKFGGNMEDYLDIHILMDSSKATINDARHRALTHTSWFIRMILPRIFGEIRKNSADKNYSVVDVAEQHVLEDYNMLFVPTPQDFLAEMPLEPWMDNARDNKLPPSRRTLKKADEPVEPAPRRKVPQLRPQDSFASRPCARAGRGVLD